jgi:integral membrane sensor domain MASE1
MTPARENVCRTIEAVSLTLAAVFTFVTMLYGAGWKLEWSGFYPWALSPYFGFFVLSRFAGRFSSFAAGAGCIAAAVMLAFTLFAYGDGMYIHTSSTSALIFIFAPLYLLVGGLVVFGIALAVNRLTGLRRDESAEDL